MGHPNAEESQKTHPSKNSLSGAPGNHGLSDPTSMDERIAVLTENFERRIRKTHFAR